ncbi:hypothetical protein B0J13DRAFT_332628 [Dactylonectria estremocensis]|uniref:Secreted protein n=1 Tax=Dactylonectria estremocensis TaxID=1079267 RepID=A0A9P9EVD1_9HYPO|nr:hypothetical protein B0J13DRAFT_332628 [Dactylonectria estremocensis]
MFLFSSGRFLVNVGVPLSLLLFVAPHCSANGLNPAKHSCSPRTRSRKSKYPLQPMYRRLNPKTSCPSTRGVSSLSRWVTTRSRCWSLQLAWHAWDGRIAIDWDVVCPTALDCNDCSGRVG